jgi:uncharacterized protein YecT (DUF1311 family)
MNFRKQALKKLSLLFSILIFSIPCVFAESKDELQSCINKTLDENRPQDEPICYARESERLDGLMNALFTSKLSDIDNLPLSINVPVELQKKARAEFVKAQEHWLVYLESACKFESDTTLGSGHALVFYGCKIDLTKSRIAELTNSGF